MSDTKTDGRMPLGRFPAPPLDDGRAAAARARRSLRRPAPCGAVAPSPTGDPHVGTAYMSLFNLAFARQQGGQFVLRIEDTDRARYVADSEQQIFDTLHWLGLTGTRARTSAARSRPYRQSERLDTYRPYVERLLADGHAYHCWCSTERLAEMREEQQKAKLPTGYDRLCLGKTREERAAAARLQRDAGRADAHPRRRAARLRRPDPRRGDRAAPGRPGDPQGRRLPDLPPRRRRRRPRDGHHPRRARRGVDQLDAQARAALPLARLEPPKFAHMPLLRNTDKSKISKRKNPAARLTWFREQGYLPEALRQLPRADGLLAAATATEIFTLRRHGRATSTGRGSTRSARSSTSTSSSWLNGALHPPARGRGVHQPSAALPARGGDHRREPVARGIGSAQARRSADPGAHRPADRGSRSGPALLRR